MAALGGSQPSAEQQGEWDAARAVFDRCAAADSYLFSVPMWKAGELAGIRYDPGGRARGDLRLLDREIRVRGKAGTGADREDRLRGRPQPGPVPAGPRPPPAGRPAAAVAGSRRPGALTPNGVYQVVARAGDRAGAPVYPHRFRHHFSHTWSAAAPRAT
jgi:hypothetical protein